MTVTFTHVSARYGRRTILEDVSFTADSGGVTALIGGVLALAIIPRLIKAKAN